ncbi:target of Nesh-SH3 isoform X2 [Periophthalmus magnuspinnatus]|uniref:target of Nesh-SH3 isoform X2 n=1 Tax=Periophthalmus magnuspinnatus TaxID=409849 RepID=UPI00145B8E75|nr:target of Nesh-SH3 isoform X2 [Periophthalmus magnuspinnatus]
MQLPSIFPLILLFVAGIVLSGPSTPIRSRVRRQNMKVRINATGDTIVMKFLRPSPDTKLEGYILGYGSSMFSKQFIQLPENGKPYETEFDAEPKYLIAVQPIPVNDVKKQCTGKVELEKPLHLVIGTVTPTSVLLSWGTLLKTPYESNIMNDCLEDGHYTVRYRERNRKWNYQTCPTSDTVIDNLKPNTVYEFGVQPNTKEGNGHWSKPVIHNISNNGGSEDKAQGRKPVKRIQNPLKPFTNGQHSLPFTPRHVPHNRTQVRPQIFRNVAPKTTLGREDVISFILPHQPMKNVQELNPKISKPAKIQPHIPKNQSQTQSYYVKFSPFQKPEIKTTLQPYPPAPAFTTKPPAAVSPPTPKPKAQTTPPKTSAAPMTSLQTETKSTITLKTTLTSKVQSSPPLLKTQAPPKVPPKGSTHRKKQPNPQPHPRRQSQASTDPAASKHARPTAPSSPEEGKPLQTPALATEKAGSGHRGTGSRRPSTGDGAHSSTSSSTVPPVERKPPPRVAPNPSRTGDKPLSQTKTFHSSNTPGAGGVHHRGNAFPKPAEWPKEKPAVLQPSSSVNKKTNLVGKPSDDKLMDLKQGDKESILNPFPQVTTKPKPERRQQTTTSAPAVNNSRFDGSENSSVFRPRPASDVDIMGKKRFVAPHVIYKTDKKPDEPCSITSSMAYFPDEEGNDISVTGPPKAPPSNLTVVTVEGCPSFVILDWEKSDNETREYEVVSTTKGPNGEEISVLTTNQTHTAVENLKPESSYEFKVTPRNELGTGPSSDPVSFSTESADPRVSEYVAGKDAIWTQFPFKADAYSECNGKQYVKRTWYRKFVGIQLCNSLRYKIYLSDSLNGKFYNIGDQTGFGEDHCQFVDSFLDGRTGTQLFAEQLPSRQGFFRALRQEPVHFGEIGGKSHVTYVGWYECGTPIPGKW